MKSRPKRWEEACSSARGALDKMQAIFDSELTSALEELVGLKSEYEEWSSNLPDGLQGGVVADMLAEIEQLDVETSMETDFFDAVGELLDTAEGMDLPRGFGRARGELRVELARMCGVVQGLMAETDKAGVTPVDITVTMPNTVGALRRVPGQPMYRKPARGAAGDELAWQQERELLTLLQIHEARLQRLLATLE